MYNILLPIHVINPRFTKPEAPIDSVSVTEDYLILPKADNLTLYEYMFNLIKLDGLHATKVNRKWYLSWWVDTEEEALRNLIFVVNQLNESVLSMNRLKDVNELILCFHLDELEDYTLLVAYDIKTGSKFKF